MTQVTLNTPAPEFVIKDFHGNTISLAQFREKQHVLLVFNRGFTWPFCREHMAQLRRENERFVERDVVVLVIGPESVKKFASYFSQHDLPFIGLPDPQHRILKQYGQEIKLFKFGRMPAQVLVDKSGIARFVHYGQSMKDIPSSEEILVTMDEINQEESVNKSHQPDSELVKQ